MTAMKRWTCPTCGGGKLSPSKPRRDDVRRYCLPCSEKTGRLVPRVCGALKGEREAREEARKAGATKAAEARKARRAAAAEAERARYTAGGEYLPGLVRRYWRVLIEEARALKPGAVLPLHDAPPQLVITRSSSPMNASGRGSRRRTSLRLGASVDKAAACELLLHELCHGVCNTFGADEGGHGPTFLRTLRNAAARLWGVEVIVPGTHRYVLDDLITVELRAKWGLPPGPTHWLDRERQRKSAAKRNTAPAAPAEEAPPVAGPTEVSP